METFIRLLLFSIVSVIVISTCALLDGSLGSDTTETGIVVDKCHLDSYVEVRTNYTSDANGNMTPYLTTEYTPEKWIIFIKNTSTHKTYTSKDRWVSLNKGDQTQFTIRKGLFTNLEYNKRIP